MEMEIMQEYVVVVVFGICLAVGYIVKHSLTMIPNKYIPLLMGLLGTITNVWLNNGSFTPAIFLGGLTSGLASTGAFEIIKNIKNK